MKSIDKTLGTDDVWDVGELGADPNFAELLPGSDEAMIDSALGLQPISIRLQRSLIEDYKLIAQLQGMGYQPLMRQVLARFADCEKKRILREVAARVIADRQECEAARSREPQARRSGTHG